MKLGSTGGAMAVCLGTLCAACSSGDGAAPASAPVTHYSPPPMEPPSRQTITLSNPQPQAVQPATPPRPPWEPGQRVRAVGTKSDKPWQHLMAPRPGKLVEYLDLEDGGQTVIYVTKFPRCRGLLEVEGIVMEVLGQSKRPGRPGGGDDPEETYSELHIDVERFRCLD